MQNRSFHDMSFAQRIRDVIIILLLLGLLFVTTGWFFQCRVDHIDQQMEKLRSNETH